jgi:DNA-binding PadR family transcriptional regulator
MSLTSEWPGWSRAESDHLKISLLEIVGRNPDPIQTDQMSFELDRTDIPAHVLRQLLDDLVAASLVLSVDRRLSGRSSYAITPNGQQYLANLHGRRTDLARRNRAVRSALLDWLYAMKEKGQRSPVIDGFIRDPRCWFEGQPIPDAVAHEAAKYLKELGLITGTAAWGGVIPRPGLTVDGIDCVEHYGGDVQAWRQETRLGMTISTGGGDYISNSNNIQTMRDSAGSQQAQGTSTITATEVKEVQDLAAHLRRLVQLPDVASEDRDKLTELFEELEAKSSKPDADAAAVRSVWDKIKTVLEAAGPSLNWVLTKMVLPGVLG